MLKYSVIIFDGLVSRIRYARYGYYHRDNGPSIIWEDGEVSYYHYGRHIRCENLEHFLKIRNLSP
jgi:hypothetical protein